MSVRGQEIARYLEQPGSTPDEVAPAELAAELIRRERARANLIDFASYVDLRYKAYPLHKLIARKLEDVASGRNRRLAIFVPPAVGKSRLASELFPAWCFGPLPAKSEPSLEIIEASYDADLAFSFGRSVRNLIMSPTYRRVFPAVEIAADASAMDEWKTTYGGEYKAEGVGGGLIGFHAHIAVIDDPFKSYESAASPGNRRAVWDWYTGVLLNRLRPYKDGPGAVVLIMQRWHDDDLGGRVEKLNDTKEEAWDILSIPSISEANDPLGRAPGEPLLPEGPNRRTLEELAAIRARNPALFMALHQQKPVADKGDIFQPGWFRRFRSNELPKHLTVYGTSDFAYSKGKGDFTVHVVFGVDESGHVWLLEVFREQCDVFRGVEVCVDLMKRHQARKWLFERAGFHKIILPLIQKHKDSMYQTSGELVWTTLEDVSIYGLGGKDSPDRAGAFAGAMQMGLVHVPSDAAWLGDLEWELGRFPNGRYDDQVDALALIGIKLSNLRGFGVKPSENSGREVQMRPHVWTFNEVRAANTAKRLGQHRRLAPMVLPPLELSALDDADVDFSKPVLRN